MSHKRQEVLDCARRELKSILPELRERMCNSGAMSTVQISIGLAALVAYNATFRQEAFAIASKELGVHNSKITLVNAGSASALCVER